MHPHSYMILYHTPIQKKNAHCFKYRCSEIAENPFKEEFESLTISNPLAMELQENNEVATSTTKREIPVRFAKLSIDASRDISDHRVKVSSLTRNRSSIW